MTDTPDATRGDAPRAAPVPSTGSGTSAPPQEAESVEASEPRVGAEEAEPVEASGPHAATQGAEPVEAAGTSADAEEAEPVEASGPSADAEGAEPVEASAARDEPARQPVVRVRGARRARLLPAPGTTAEPAPADDRERGVGAAPAASGPNDDRMLRDVPPHY